MKPTLIVIGTHLYAKGFPHAAELRPGLLSQEGIDRLVDERKLEEVDANVRRSLYALFPEFSGVSAEAQPFEKELAPFALPQ